jgi:hypothetical protein
MTGSDDVDVISGGGSTDISLNSNIDEDSIHVTAGSDEMLITDKSTLELVLRKYKETIETKTEWSGYGGISLTVLSILLVADFEQSFGINENFWLALYAFLLIYSLYRLFRAVIWWFRNNNKTDIEFVISKLKQQES